MLAFAAAMEDVEVTSSSRGEIVPVVLLGSARRVSTAAVALDRERLLRMMW